MEDVGIALGVRSEIISPPIIGERKFISHHQAVARKVIIIIIRIKLKQVTDLFEVIEAINRLGLLFSFTQHRKEQTGKDGDDRDDHQKLDQGESGVGAAKPISEGIHDINFSGSPLEHNRKMSFGVAIFP